MKSTCKDPLAAWRESIKDVDPTVSTEFQKIRDEDILPTFRNLWKKLNLWCKIDDTSRRKLTSFLAVVLAHIYGKGYMRAYRRPGDGTVPLVEVKPRDYVKKVSRDQLETFFLTVAELTLNHRTAELTVDDDCQWDTAFVTPKDLGEALEQVDPEWWRHQHDRQRRTGAKKKPAKVKHLGISAQERAEGRLL